MNKEVTPNLLEEPTDGINYQELYGKMLEMLASMQNVISLANGMLNSVTEHNTSGSSHQDLRDLFTDDIVDTPDLNNAIASHDRDPESHIAMRESLTAMIEDTTKIEQLISAAVYSHDIDSISHMGIRTQLQSLFQQVGNTDFNKVLSDIATLQDDVGLYLQARLLQIENTNVLQDRAHRELSEELALLQTQMEELDRTVFDIAHIGVTTEMVKRHELELYMHRYNLRSGYNQHTDNFNILDFSTTLPMYLGINHQCDFNVHGVTGVTYSVDVGTSRAIFSSMEDIGVNDIIRLTTDASGEDGSIRHFVLNIHHTSSGDTISTVMPYYVATPIKDGDVSIDGLPVRVEPSKKYICRIVNSAETGGRFTYDFDPMESELKLTNTDNSSSISTNEQLTLEIPDTAPRGEEITARVKVMDAYNSAHESYVTITLNVNHVPNVEDLESNIPTIMVPGTSRQVYFHTSTDILDKCVYAIKEPHEHLTFSKLDGISPHEMITISVSKDAVRGDALEFTLFITDQYDAHTATMFYIEVNILPSAESVSSNIPEKIDGGSVLKIQLAGGNDDDGRVVSYKLVCSEGLTPSKTSGIQDYEDVYINVAKVDKHIVRSIDVYVKDDIGEFSAEPKHYDVEIAPVYNLAKPMIVNIQSGDTLDVGFTVVITDVLLEVDAPSISSITGE